MTTDAREQFTQRLTQIKKERAEAEQLIARLDADRRSAILDALADGIGPTELTALTGLSRARIYQIRDGRR